MNHIYIEETSVYTRTVFQYITTIVSKPYTFHFLPRAGLRYYNLHQRASIHFGEEAIIILVRSYHNIIFYGLKPA